MYNIWYVNIGICIINWLLTRKLFDQDGNGDSTAQPPQGHGHDPNKPHHNNNVNINNIEEPNQTEIDLSDKNITELKRSDQIF